MKIKKIEITGFKSFMEKAVLTFPERITSIVGPNGCGKSNIVDAIRWVIGEQSSKHLRGSGMEDMIFNGSEKFSPLGMAEVKITFTNDNINVPVNYSEYSEITVSRRLFKSGESQYRLNNTRCRLMDVRELFMDTGISAKAYAIIEQGKVGQIVGSKPEERRIIIEEAAGITKYKNRKDSAVKKMEATKLNLQRTKDIVAELKKQLNAVERQAKRAEEFKKQRKRLKEIELYLIRFDSMEVHEALAFLDKELRKLDENLLETNKKMSEKDSVLESLKLESLDVEKQLSATQELYLNRMNDIKKKENEIEFKERQKVELQKNKNRSLQEIGELNSRVKRLQRDIEESEAKSKKAQDDWQLTEESIHALQKEFEELNRTFREKAGTADKEKSELVNILTNIARTRNAISNFEQHIASFGTRL